MASHPRGGGLGWIAVGGVAGRRAGSYIYTCIHTHTHIWIHMTGHVGGLAYHHSFIDIHHYLHTDDGGIPTRVLMTLYNPGLSCVFIHIFTIRWFHIYGESQCFSFRSIFMFVIYKKPWHHGFHSFNHQNPMISGMAMAPLLSAQPSPRTRLPNPKSRPRNRRNLTSRRRGTQRGTTCRWKDINDYYTCLNHVDLMFI